MLFVAYRLNKREPVKLTFIYGPGIDEPICMIAVNVETETRYYYHFDGLGSVAALSNSSADIVERYSYDVFGGILVTVGLLKKSTISDSIIKQVETEFQSVGS